MSEITRVSTCRLCDSGDLDLIISFTPTPPGDQYLEEPTPQACYPLDVLCCRSCGAVQLADTVDPALIYTNYLYTTSVSKGLQEHYATYAREVMTRIVPKDGALVFDIGSNDGTLLRHFQVYGCRVMGIDPARMIAAQATANGIPTFCGYFTEATAIAHLVVNERADLITANHIMANVADLHDFIKGVKHLLAEDGTFVFETGYWPAIMRHRLIDTIEHEHIHYFAVRPLVQFFARHGLALVHVEEQPTKGGSLRGFVQHAGAKPDASVRRLASHEQRWGYTDPETLKTWVAGLDALKQQVADLIATKGEEQWIGYGAAVGSTLLLHHFGLGPHLSCLVDANPVRHGRFSPGFHLPVYEPLELMRRNPDKVVILAWRYAAQIMAQHHNSVGKCVIPLPALRLA